MQLEQITVLVKTDLQLVDQLIDDNLSSSVDLINQINSHIIHSGGKRLRPLIILICARICGYQENKHLTLAAAIELLHTATLLHDDVIDTSKLRRGLQTANNIWDNKSAILAGDFIYSKASQLIISIGNLEILHILANATNTIIEGEMIQANNKNNTNLTEEEYIKIIHYKTATLFATATELCAILADSATATRKALAQYGLHLGTAFQITDDLLDYGGAPSNKLGKNIGDDLKEGKLTLPLIHLLKYGTNDDKTLVKNAINTGNINSLPAIQAALEKTGSIKYTVDFANRESALAKQAIATLSNSPYKDAALALVDFVISRDS